MPRPESGWRCREAFLQIRNRQRLLDESATLIDEHGILLFAPTLHERRAKLATLLGDDAGRERELREAHRLYTEMGAVGHSERVGRELGL